MSTLNNLKLVNAKRPVAMPSVMVRRHKLIKKIHEQLQLAEANQSGVTFAPTRIKYIRDAETGLTRAVAVPKRVRAWWWMSDSGRMCLNVKYGSNTLELSKGKFAVEIDSPESLVDVLVKLKDATEAGELDAQIEAAAGVLKSGFRKLS